MPKILASLNSVNGLQEWDQWSTHALSCFEHFKIAQKGAFVIQRAITLHVE